LALPERVSYATVSTIAADLGHTSVFGALCGGGCLHVMGAERIADGDAFAAYLAEHEIDVLKITPSHLAALMGGRDAAAVLPRRCLVLGGEPARTAWVDEIRALAPGLRIVNHYGPTETTVGALAYVTDWAYAADGALPETAGGTVPIGLPLANARAYVLDAALRPLPAGIPGELCIGGRGVARGYLDRPALTAERFVPDPFADEPGARMYRTGDRAKRLADGTVEFLGRIDQQVKVRGFRVEPGEVEGVLRAHPAVHEAVVVARPDRTGSVALVAYVVGADDADGAAIDVHALHVHCAARLPTYMVPSAFVVLDALPLTENGKLDRRALPEPGLASAAGTYVAPRTPAEEVLAGIWAEVLRVERVGIHESFFDLGGHSLLAMRLASRVREVFGVELPLRALFEAPAVAQLAARVEEIRRASAPALPAVVPVDRTGPLPLSFAQERMWFLHRLQPDSAFYTVPTIWRLGGALDEAALERALGEVVRRHEVLRTTFPEVDGAPAQVVAPFTGFTLPVEDVSALPEEDREAAVRRRIDQEALRPFDLAAGPLFRPLLLRASADERVLLVMMHHILRDEWSAGILHREVTTLYAAYRDGAQSPLPELPVQYADYAVWQREQMRGQALEAQLAYWTERLAGAPAVLELPTDFPRPAVQTFAGAWERVQLSRTLLDGLQALARTEGATLYMVLLSAFQALLAKYTGSDDIVVGSPISGRTRREVEGLIGIFLNTLVLRTELGGDPGFRQVVRRVREGTLGAYEHQEVPFERLVEALQPGRSLSHSPLFQVMFVLHDSDDAPASAGQAMVDGAADAGRDVAIQGMGVEVRTAKFDLTLSLTPRADGLSASLEYSTDLFARGTIQRMLGHLERVLEQAVADADVPLSAIQLLDAAERRQVVEGWNATDAEYPSGTSIHALFEGWAARTPDAVAVEFGDVAVTYGEMDARANQLAHHLRRYGVGPEVRVALCLERGPDLIAAVLGILKAGGAYVGLDPAYPPERLAYMLADSAAAVLVTRDGLRGILPPVDGLPIVSLDGAAAEIAGESAERLESGTVPHSLAHVMYTSGSTGVPKGVAIQHQSVVRLVHHPAYARLAPDEVMLQAGPISFDSSTLEVWSALLTGGRLAVLPSGAPSLEELGGVLRKHGVTVAWITSGLFQAMVEERLDDLGGMRQVMSGGDVLPAWHVLKVRERFPHIRVVNGYGPTENTVFTCCYTIPEGWSGATIPVGGPTPNTRVYVLDRSLRPLPVGIPGELFAAGDGLARGYLNRPALTAEKFLPDPFVPGARMYRTGDLGRWLPDGTIDFRGRIDTQVKIRGFRIEPGEVEALLRGEDGVRDCAVIVREDTPGDKRLVAYVVGDAGADALRARMRSSLPDYLVPAAFVTVDALPLTPNGKLDRRALPAPDYAGAADAYVAPRTPTEEMLAGTWAEVLRLERVGVAENFFHLGGHSLLGTRVVSRIREVFGVELPLRALFEGPTVAEMAERVEEIRRAGIAVLPPVVPVERTGPLPLSFAQERLYFLDRLAPGSALYNMPFVLRLDGALDVRAAERALGEVVRRHEALRTIFRETDAGTMQLVVPFDGFVLPVEDFAALADDERQAAVRRRALQEAMRPFDLSAGPLFRALLLRLGADEHVLLLTMHHIVGDGWSMDVLFREMSVLYAACAQGGESPLPPLPVQYADFAVWQREQLQGTVLDRQMAYWKDQLTGAPEVLDLPTDRPRSAVQTQRGGAVSVMLPEDVLQRLTALARAEGATLYMVLLGAFQSLLSRYSGSEDIVVGTPIAGRTRRETEGLIGFFVNTLVLRTDLAGNPSFREVVRRVRDVTLGAYDHQEVPFEQLVAELQPERSLSHSPLFQVMFTLNEADAGQGGTPLPGVSVRAMGGEKPTTKFDLTLT
ncbi:MAG TPA: amino acid adenylation domain-containing protein, partial [Longimicrobium sp.]|nr:amino acid adenylation domain-containing protein [Longimicrobium sp.]